MCQVLRTSGVHRMKTLFYLLGFLFCLPVTLAALVFVLLLFLFGQVSRLEFRRDLTLLWRLNSDGFFYRSFTQWSGFSIGAHVFIFPCFDEEKNERTELHERKHCHQWYTYGLAFPVIYILESLRIFFFVKEQHSYYDNVYEIAARKYAGQQVHIPRSFFQKDRWIWW